jgi:predicted MFS family arabinose efflux permease
MGVAVAGIGVGTLVVAPLAEWLIDRYGWRQTYVIMAIGSALLLALASVGARRPAGHAGPGEVRPLAEVIRGSKTFALMYVSIALLTFSLFIPFVFLDDYLDEKNISGSAALLVGAIGLSSVLGRLGLGALAAFVTPLRLYQGSFLVVACSFLLWLAIGSSYPLLLVFAVVLGVAYGGFIALAPAVSADFFGPVGLGGVLGALYTAAGVGGLVGSPAAGELIDRFGYPTTLVVAFGFGLAAFACLLPLGAGTDT